MTADEIIKLTKALLKGLSENDMRKINQYLIRRNITWFTLKAIGKYTGSDRTTVSTNIRKVYKDKQLLSLAEDVEYLIKCAV